MKSSFDILSGLYKVIKPVVSDGITGKVYLINEPKGDQKQNVIIGVLNNPGDYLQEAYLNVNISVNDINDSFPDLKTMQDILKLVKPVLDEKCHYINEVNLHLSILDDKGPMKDMDNDGKHFYNIRVKCITI